MLGFSDKDGKFRMIQSIKTDGLPALQFYDKVGKSRIGLFVLPDGSPSLSLHDKSGRSRAVLGSTDLETTRTGGVEKRPESSLVLFDKEGKVLRSLP